MRFLSAVSIALLLQESAAAAPELFPNTRSAASPLQHMNLDNFSRFGHHSQFHH